jgi:cell division control protein 6
MGKFKDILAYDETLFRDERVFDQDYIPKDFNYRDSQLEAIAVCMRPAIRGGRPINARILGPPATGKTTAIKLAFQEMEETTDKVACVHINCQIHSSKFAVFSQIHKKVVGHLPPETGIPFPRVYDAIFKKLIKEDKSLIVALDDMNYLFYDRQANEIIYDILRAHEIFPGVKTAIFGVLSEVEFPFKLDVKVSSMYRPQEIFFQPYKFEEILSILIDRATMGFYPGVISDDIIEEVAKYAYSAGDLRRGIEILRVSALIAEAEASRKIKREYVEKAFEKSKDFHIKMLLNSISPEERELLKVIASSSENDSGSIYEIFKGKTGISYTKYYRMINKLEAIRLLDTKFADKDKKGRTRKIFLRFDKSIL